MEPTVTPAVSDPFLSGVDVFPAPSPGNPLSLVDLVPLLQKTLKDESSVTCKLACSAVRVRGCGPMGGLWFTAV